MKTVWTAVLMAVLFSLSSANADDADKLLNQFIFENRAASARLEDSLSLRLFYLEALNGKQWFVPVEKNMGEIKIPDLSLGVVKTKNVQFKGVVSLFLNTPKDWRLLNLINPFAPKEYFGPPPQRRSHLPNDFDFNAFGDATMSSLYR